MQEIVEIPANAELDQLVGEIRELDDQARDTAKTAIELAMQTGRKLLQARSLIEQDDSIENKDKAFSLWREEHFAAPAKTMREYMNLAQAFEGRDIGRIPQTVLKELAAPKNEQIREAAFEELVEKENVSVKEAKELITDHRVKAGLEQPKPELTPEELAQKRLGAMVELFGLDQVRTWLQSMEQDIGT